MSKKTLRSSAQKFNAEHSKLEENKEGTCNICSQNIVKNQDYFLTCSNCQQSNHATCLKFNQQQYDIATSYPWLCHKCKICSICHKPKNLRGGTLIICDTCDRAYHETCFDPPIKWSKKYWICNLCQNPKINISPINIYKGKDIEKWKDMEVKNTLSEPIELDNKDSSIVKRQCVIKQGVHYFPPNKKRLASAGNHVTVVKATAAAANRILRRSRKSDPITKGNLVEKATCQKSKNLLKLRDKNILVDQTDGINEEKKVALDLVGGDVKEEETSKIHDGDLRSTIVSEECIEARECSPHRSLLCKPVPISDPGAEDLIHFTDAILIGRIDAIVEARAKKIGPKRTTLAPPSGCGIKEGKKKAVAAPHPPPGSLNADPSENRCPLPGGCEGLGHLSGALGHHVTLGACPAFHGTTPEACARRWGTKIRPLIDRLQNDQTVKAEFSEKVPLESASPLSASGRRVGKGVVHLLPHQKIFCSGDNTPLELTYDAEEYSPDMEEVSAALRVKHAAIFAKNGKTREPPLEGLTPHNPDLQMFLDAQAILALVQESDLEQFSPPSAIKKVCFGTSRQMDTWYPSPFPSEKFGRGDTIYFCEFCLSYFESQIPFLRHLTKCRLKYPPGNEIYRQGAISIFEVDGRGSKSYCTNLCLLSKLFMESKTLCYEVEHFWFYVMTLADAHGHCHLVGYFSKEKQNFQKNTVSCILIMPHYMRKGYGWILIDFSYLLDRIEDKIGSPERPLSDHGLVTYRNYWKSIILNYLSRCDEDKISIKDLSQESGIHPDDIVSTLQYFRLLKSWRGNHIILKKDLEALKQSSKKIWKHLPCRVDEKYLHWKPHN